MNLVEEYSEIFPPSSFCSIVSAWAVVTWLCNLRMQGRQVYSTVDLALHHEWQDTPSPTLLHPVMNL